jgi:release factor glutamine methyltransferase
LSSVVDRLRAAGCVFAEDEARLLTSAAGSSEALDSLVARRVSGEPLEYVLGWVQFCGLRLAIEPGVFVPRRRTQLLARSAATVAIAGDVLVDLCCGCGAVAAAVADAVPGLEVHAVDVDAAAVRCARRNVPGEVHHGDLYAALPDAVRGRVAVLTGNAPYVPTEALSTMPIEARRYEPRVALDGGPDGLDILRRIVTGASGWLRPGGWLFVESSTAQAPRLVEQMSSVGLDASIRTDDDIGGTLVAGRASRH